MTVNKAEKIKRIQNKRSEEVRSGYNMKLKDFIANRDFDVNADYEIYHGIWNDGGECIWDSVMGRLSQDDLIAQYNITYITVDVDTRKIIIEVA